MSKIRKSQAVGKTKLSKTKKFEIIKDSKYHKKGDTVELNEPTEALFRAKKLIK